MTRQKTIGHLIMFIVALIFGLNIPVTKSLMPQMIGAVGLTYLRFLFGAVVFWILSLFFPYEKVPKKDMFLFFFCGVFGAILNQLSFVVGLEYSTPINAGIVITITPVIVMVLAAVFLKEPISLQKAGGVVMGIAGALLVVLSGAKTTSAIGENNLIGGLLCLGSSLSYAIYLIISKPIVKKYSSVTLMKWVFLYAALLSLPLGYKDLSNAEVWKQISDFSVVWRLLYVTVMATCVTYLMMPMALKRIRPTTVSMYNYLQPLAAAVVAIIIGQDVLTWQKPVAGGLIFLGVYLVTQSPSREDIEKRLSAEQREK